MDGDDDGHFVKRHTVVELCIEIAGSFGKGRLAGRWTLLKVTMSAEDLESLSYKELQALASKYKIPGNVKKQVLVKVLQAVRTGNHSEVTRLITDVKKNRKKRKLKIIKKEDQVVKMRSHNNSNNRAVHNNYSLFPIHQQQQSQQYPFQWVGAEEEVNTYKYDDMKYNLTYNDIRQIVYYSSQNSYGNCDSNNNSPLLDEIMDLRTETTVSNYRSTLDTSRVNENSQQHQVALPTLEDNTNPKTMLLKKMLQAPAGANLGAIASPAPSWPVETYPLRDQSADNSDTMTAKSDINDIDEIWQQDSGMATTPNGLACNFDSAQNYDSHCYRNADSFYRPSLDNGNSLMCEQQQQQYQFELVPQTDAQESCRSWLASNPSLDVLPTNVVGNGGGGPSLALEYDTTSISRFGPCTPIQYHSPEGADLLNSATNDQQQQQQHLDNPYCFANDQMYNSQTSVMNNLLEPSEIVPELPFEEPPPPPPSYRAPHDFYDSDYNSQQQQGQPPPTPQPSIYHVDLSHIGYDSEYYQQYNGASTPLANQPTSDPLQQVHQQQQQQPQHQHTYPPPPAYGSGVLNTYWPRWSYADLPTIASRTGGRNLENTLNLCPPNYVIYSKLSETCCVFSNNTPVMTLRTGENSTATTHQQSFNVASPASSAEFRQHSFSSHCLLYNSENDSVDQTTPTSERIV